MAWADRRLAASGRLWGNSPGRRLILDRVLRMTVRLIASRLSCPWQTATRKSATTPIPPRMCQSALLLGISSPATLFSRRATRTRCKANPRTATLQGPLQLLGVRR